MGVESVSGKSLFSGISTANGNLLIAKIPSLLKPTPPGKLLSFGVKCVLNGLKSVQLIAVIRLSYTTTK